MTDRQGTHIWYELSTSDPAAAQDFYATVVGWDAAPFDGDVGAPYTIFSAGAAGVAGLAALEDQAPAPVWMGYIGVDDVDATSAQAQAAGGKVHVPPTDLPGVGRFAMLADRQGAVFYVMRGNSAQNSTSFAPRTPGRGGWHELHSTDWEDAFPFYRELFGWTRSTEMDMGPMGKYALFAHDGVDVGAMFNNPQLPHPAWLYYFNVDDLEAAAARVTEHGGSILHGPSDVPDGQRIVQAQDPQGAMFALVGPQAAGGAA